MLEGFKTETCFFLTMGKLMAIGREIQSSEKIEHSRNKRVQVIAKDKFNLN